MHVKRIYYFLLIGEIFDVELVKALMLMCLSTHNSCNLGSLHLWLQSLFCPFTSSFLLIKFSKASSCFSSDPLRKLSILVRKSLTSGLGSSTRSRDAFSSFSNASGGLISLKKKNSKLTLKLEISLFLWIF